MKMISNFEKGEIKKINPIKENEINVELPQETGKEKESKMFHFLNGYFEENEDGTIDIETENGILKKMSKDILPEDLQKEKKGKLIITFADHSEISKKVLNELLKGDQDE